jgi:hypothetical protein
VLCEISDERASMWGHCGSDVFDHLEQRGFEWFVAGSGGVLSRAAEPQEFHGNFVAVPRECRAAIEEPEINA